MKSNPLRFLLNFQVLVLISSFVLVSCFQQRSPRLSQSLEGTIFSLSDVFNLSCVLKTGDSLDEVVDWTDANNIFLEKKNSYKKYSSVKEESIVYKGVDSKGKSTKGYINNFNYVSIKSIEDKGLHLLKSSSGQEKAQIIQEGSLRCENLLTPEQHPLIIAKANHTYTLQFQILGNYLRAMIVAPPEDLPFQALAYSVKIKEGLYGMPVGGYSNIGLGYLEEIVNSDFESTRLLTFRSIPLSKRSGQTTKKSSNGLTAVYPKEAKQIQVQGNFQPFKTLLEAGSKRDVYPKDLFNGDWYYESTLTGVNVRSSDYVGYALGGSPKVRLVFKDNYLFAYSLNVENDLPEVTSISKDRWIFKIPIKHTDYEASSAFSGQILNAGLDEVLVKRERDRDRRFAQVHFGKIETPSSKNLSRFFSSGSSDSYHLRDLTISEDYIGFVIDDEVQQTRVRYSLLRPNLKSTYKPLLLSDRSFNLFPAFYSKKRVHSEDSSLRSEQYQNSYLVNRFNTNKPIVYYFSTLTSKDDYVRNLGREVVSSWNQVFQKAGIQCPQGDCFVLDESKDVNLGDLRYNILNFTNPRELSIRGAFLGYGPTVSDTDTGEVISATANVRLQTEYLSLLKSVYRHMMKVYDLDISFLAAATIRENRHYDEGFSGMNFLKKELFAGRLQKFLIEPFLLNPKSKETKPVSLYGLTLDKKNNPEIITSLDQIIQTKEDRKLLEERYQLSVGEDPSSLSVEQMYAQIEQQKTQNPNKHDCALHNDFALTSGLGSSDLIEAFCGDIFEELKPYDPKRNSPHQRLEMIWNLTKSQDVKDKIHACVQKILPIYSLNTGIHEMGHNVSLRHNFSGSADKKNFLSLKDFDLKYVLEGFNQQEKSKLLSMDVVQPASSTVMDYLGSQAINLIPGAYDVGFVKFIYSSKVEIRDKSTGYVYKGVDSFNVTPELVDAETNQKLGFDIDRKLDWDYVKFYKVCTDEALHFSNKDPFCNIFDVGTTAEEIVKNHYNLYVKNYDNILAFFSRSLPLYHKWRLDFSRYIQNSDAYTLANMDLEQYEQILNKICNDKNHEMYDLCQASTFISEALISKIFNESDHYCLVKNRETGIEDKMPFRDIYEEALKFEVFRRERSSCYDFGAILAHSSYELLGEVGRPLYPFNFSSDINNVSLHTSYDRIGNLLNKIYSSLLLSISTHSNVSYDHNSTPISLMDEPTVRNNVHELLKLRILHGDNLAEIHAKTPIKSFQFKHFDVEKSTGILSYNFSNEKGYLGFSLKLLHKQFNIVNIIKYYQGLTKNLVNLRPLNLILNQAKIDTSEGKNRINLTYFEVLSEIKFAGGSILEENKDLYPSEHSSILIMPIDFKGVSSEFIKMLDDIEIKQSFIKFWKIFDKENNIPDKEGQYARRGFRLQERYDATLQHLDKIVNSAASIMVAPDPYMHITLISFLYDHLERGGEDQGSLSVDSIVPYLQLTSLTNFLSERNIDLFAVPLPPRPPSSFDSNPGFFSLGAAYLSDYLEKNPEELIQYADVILTLYLIDLFRSDKYSDSFSRITLEKLLDKVKDQVEEIVNDSNQDSSEQKVAEDNVADILFFPVEKIEQRNQKDFIQSDPFSGKGIRNQSKRNQPSFPLTLEGSSFKDAEDTDKDAEDTEVDDIAIENNQEDVQKDIQASDKASEPVKSIPAPLSYQEKRQLAQSMFRLLSNIDVVKSLIDGVKEIKKYPNNKFLQRVLVRDVYFDQYQGLPFLSNEPPLKQEKPSAFSNFIDNRILLKLYYYIAYELDTLSGGDLSRNKPLPFSKDKVSYLANAMKDPNLNKLASTFSEFTPQSILNSYKRNLNIMLSTEKYGLDFPYFLRTGTEFTGEIYHSRGGQEFHNLVDLEGYFINRMENNFQSQKNLIYGSLIPYFDIESGR